MIGGEGHKKFLQLIDSDQFKDIDAALKEELISHHLAAVDSAYRQGKRKASEDKTKGEKDV